MFSVLKRGRGGCSPDREAFRGKGARQELIVQDLESTYFANAKKLQGF